MKIGIIGTGAYAISLASILENKDIHIKMWTKLENEFNELTTKHTNSSIINYELSDKVSFTMDIKELILESDALILAIPAKFVKDTVKEMKGYVKNQHILIATKGCEVNSNMLLHDYLKKELKTNKMACISGPSFAVDVIKKEPIGLTLASKNKTTISYFYELFSDISYLSIETINDIIGCELCGILKNIMAIFTGILDGMKVTHSTNAKFLVEASLEIQKIIKIFGGNNKTFYTYAGFGDFILTCTSINSRNYTFGKLIGENKDFKTYQKNTTIEGLENLDTIKDLLQEKRINSRIIDLLYEIVYLSKPKELILEYLKHEK